VAPDKGTLAEPVTTPNGAFAALRRVRDVLSPGQRRRAAALTVLTLVETVLDVLGLALVPPLVYLVSDLSIVQRNPILAHLFKMTRAGTANEFVIILVTAVFIVFVLRHAFGLFVLHRQHQFAYDVVLELSRRQFRDHLAMDYETFRRIPSTVATRDIAIVPAEFGSNVLLPCGVLLTEGLVVLWILLGILIVDPRVMGLMVLVVLPPVLVTRRLIRGRAQEIAESRVAARAEGYRVLAQGLFGFAYLKLSARGEYFVEKSLRAFRELFRAETGLALLGHVPRQLVELSAVAGIGALIAYAMAAPQRDADLVTVLALVVAAAYRVMPSMTRMLAAATRIKGSVYVLSLLPEAATAGPTTSPTSVEPAEFKSALEFDNVSFAYEGGEGFALRDVSFAVRPGERIGFVGPSGSGKTTLMNLVLRFLREQQGRILVDGRPLRPDDDRRWQRLLGFVQQDPYLLDGSLAENIAFGEGPDEIDRPRIEAALRASSLGTFIDSLPKGIDSKVGEFGSTLSGGQRQRIAIARALYRNASVLVLDEATSALDAETEREVIETLRQLTSDRTKTLLVIAHHGEMLGVCDRIYELDQGRIVKESSVARTQRQGAI
jgi:ABC-type multidrug transport system fused ATPase/permease subunit